MYIWYGFDKLGPDYNIESVGNLRKLVYQKAQLVLVSISSLVLVREVNCWILKKIFI